LILVRSFDQIKKSKNQEIKDQKHKPRKPDSVPIPSFI